MSWIKLDFGWLKYNIDGESRGNWGETSTIFLFEIYVNDDLLYAEAKILGVTNSLCAKATTI